MKCLMLLASAIGSMWTLSANDILFLDDFEKASAKRIGNPEIVSGMTSPGLLSHTRMGVYRGESVTIADKDEGWVVPAAGKIRFAYGFRLYGFGDGDRVPSTLSTRFSMEANHTDFTITHNPASEFLTAEFGGKKLSIPYDALPADFSLSFDVSGQTELSVTSLSDSQKRSAKAAIPFFKVGNVRFSVKTTLHSATPGTAAEVKLDNLSASLISPEKKTGDVPTKIRPMQKFDPVEAGWKLVFSDDFNGDSIDETKWEARSFTGFKHAKVKDGKLMIDVDFGGKDGKTLETSSIWTKQSFLYGFFEARLKFTKQPGWWAAFWLYGDTVGDPFVDGFEIDIFEDYYTRRLDDKGNSRAIIDHNLHLVCNATLKSWNYMEPLKGSIDEYHTIAVKWTPFEITYYMDGEVARSSAAHSPWTTVTFDAFNHGAGAVPLKAIFSGQIMKQGSSWLKGLNDLSKSKMPETYCVDWVRIYAYPDEPENRPAVSWSERYASGQFNLMRLGDSQTYRVTAKPAERTGAPIRAVYLFDSGYLLGWRKEPPYEFKIDFTEEYFNSTDYMKPGRQNVKPSFLGNHAIVAFAEDANGQISKTDAIQFHIVSDKIKSRPFQGKAHAIPGDINPSMYDEGGQGVAYFDGTKGNAFGKATNWRMDEDVDCTPKVIGGVGYGEWLNFTVDIAEEGDYEVSFKYGTPAKREQSMLFLCDLKVVGSAKCLPQDVKYGWSARNTAKTVLRLPGGRHVIRLVLNGSYNFETLTFRRITTR